MTTMNKSTYSLSPRVNPLRTATWRRLLKAHQSGFLAWVNSTGRRFEAFDRLASALETLLLEHVLVGGSEISALETCTRFAKAIPLVFSNCDEAIYDELLVAEAYAFVHLLERYRRATAVLEELLKAGILPMRDDGITVLDVGSGSGSSVFATSDFYHQLSQYAELHQILGLKTPPPIIRPVESSSRMVRVMHWVAELSGRTGPFFRSLENFNGLDFARLRLGVRDAAIRSWNEDEEDWTNIPSLVNWQNEWRFNLANFSHFLTQEESVRDATLELRSLFQSMRAGGVVFATGAVAGRYRRVYRLLGKLARPEMMKRITRVPARIPSSYTDEYSSRIKAVYVRVWNRLESTGTNLDRIKAKLPRDLWDPEVPLKGPAFGVRVFRRNDIRPGRYSWHKSKAAHLARQARKNAARK